MGYAKKVEDNDSSMSCSSLNESLLIAATMCIIGSQVHVHVKDGSVFSGIFYTASVDNGFGIVLKNARITKKGTSKANVASGTVVETLVILSSNIVQIIAEGVSLPSKVTTGNNEAEIVGSATKALPSQPRTCAVNKSTKCCIEGRGYYHRRQAGAPVLKSSEQIPDFHQEDNIDTQSSSSSLDSLSARVKPMEEDKLMPEPFSNGFHDAAGRPSSSDNPSSQSTNVDDTSELCQGLASSTASVPIQAVKKSKEFKLNPEAKIFSPSYTKCLSPSPVGMPDVGNIAHIPSNTPMLPLPEAIYPEVGNNPYMPQASPPSKFVPYGNLTAGHAVGSFQFPQHMIGPTVNRAHPQRFISQYQSVQAPPMLINPNPQVMVARSGQLVYVQPVSQDLVQGTPPLSPMLFRPQPTAQHVQYLKHQGVVAAGQPLQLCVSQPFTAGGLQPYGIPTQFPAMQPHFPTNQPMTVAVPNGFYTNRCNKITSLGVSELVQHCRSLETLRCGGCPSSESTARRSLDIFKPNLSNIEGETWEELDTLEIGHGGQSLRWLVWPRIDKDSLEMLSSECPRIVVNPKPSLLAYRGDEVPREGLPDVALDEPFVKDIDPKTWVVSGVVQKPTSSSLSNELPIAEKFRLAFAERDARLAPKRAKNARQHQRRAERDWMMSSDKAKAMVLASKATRSLHKS